MKGGGQGDALLEEAETAEDPDPSLGVNGHDPNDLEDGTFKVTLVPLQCKQGQHCDEWDAVHLMPSVFLYLSHILTWKSFTLFLLAVQKTNGIIDI